MKKRLKEMEEEAAALREMQAEVEKEMGASQDADGTAANQASKDAAGDEHELLPLKFPTSVTKCKPSSDAEETLVENGSASPPEDKIRGTFDSQNKGTTNISEEIPILEGSVPPECENFVPDCVEFLEVRAVQEALQLNKSEFQKREFLDGGDLCSRGVGSQGRRDGGGGEKGKNDLG
ncbi:polyadenylate-binding protein 3-like [Curcuma longa]|uniref:polyadenylate-binding protein 3-like n=1 Tax=Curcuma longa TaxID=136217 RepID=UPI003D9E495A